MAKKIAMVFGVVFVLVGLLGFVANPIVGEMGIFETDLLHNLVHLAFGAILLAVAMKSPMQAPLWLLILGVVYLILALVGFFVAGEDEMLLGLVRANTADHWLHVVLGVVLVGAGLMGKKAMP